MTAEHWFALSQETKQSADKCQVHKPTHASLLGYAQLYAMYALYEQCREQETFAEPVTVQGDLNIG